MRRLLFLGVVLVLLSGVALSALQAVGAQEDEGVPTLDPGVYRARHLLVCNPPVIERVKELGESVLGEGAKGEGLAIVLIPVLPAQPAALALQRVRLAPGASILTPDGDPRAAQVREQIPAQTEFILTEGDAFLSPAGSGGELRNDGTEEVSLLASLIVPLSSEAAT